MMDLDYIRKTVSKINKKRTEEKKTLLDHFFKLFWVSVIKTIQLMINIEEYASKSNKKISK